LNREWRGVKVDQVQEGRGKRRVFEDERIIVGGFD